MSFQKYMFTQKMFVLQIKYKSYLSIYSFYNLALPKTETNFLKKIYEGSYS